MVPRTLTGGVWEKALAPARATARNATRFIGDLLEGGFVDRERSRKIGAAVHVERLSGDVAGARADEEADRGGDLLGLSLPARERLRQHVMLGHWTIARRRDDSRRNQVDGDAGRGE